MKKLALCLKFLSRAVPAYVLAALALFIWLPEAAFAEPVAVIVNASNPVSSMSVAEVRKLYENDAVRWPDSKPVALFDLPVKNDARKKFSNAVHGKAPEEVTRDWANKKITNTAKNPPVTVSSAVVIQSKVSEDAGAIGYLSKTDVTSSKVKIVAVID